ncbi:DUF2207 domain-containing protein [Legionella sp. km772]|uniref:DUF2207 domain-containing protein n=1 Tax=Legionella sp. km772 TaxID=2498111 RepID=UPI000F8E4888|nr:DUF2207 domain-containing protein [Legionella sp. km772]RUR06517.1 DUF2207 domain-containing protein [Legionella sp. km772]
MSKIIVSLLLFFSQFIAHATPPVINDYDSTIVINKNSSIVVRETINVSTDGVEIQHGIYRDLPTRYKTIQGFNYDLGFKLISVRRDNRPEEYHIQQLSNGIRIYIGSSKSYLPPSTYTYEITYSINGALAFFANDDELYWNVTGNAWVFPILKASATVLLPQETKISKMTAYTGAQQAREKNYHQALLQANEAFFTTEQKLAPNQGLTIVVAWPKGIITPPTLLLTHVTHINL